MRFLLHALKRLVVIGLGIFAVWIVAFVVFPFTDKRTPLVLAVAITYAIAAYIILPFLVRLGTKVIQVKKAPRYTISVDGFTSDPVNMVLVGTFGQLRQAFAKAGWAEAEPLSFKSSIKMARSFVFKQSYPNAPFSTLFLFGRGQDIGFQKAIGDGPRKRHHVRFWGKDFEQAEKSLGTAAFWLNADKPDEDRPYIWLGAGTKDTGLAVTKLTFQFTHATDDDTNAERDFIIGELLAQNAIDTPRTQSTRASTEKVNRYITDGEVAVAELK